MNKSNSQLGLTKDENSMQHIISDAWKKAEDIKKDKEK
jgi:hypothetical protein